MLHAKLNKELPTTTACQSRLCLFQPSIKPEPIKSEFETSWGKVKIDGKLGQKHQSVIEAILASQLEKVDLADGKMKVLVDPYAIKKLAKLSNNEQLDAILNDIMKTVLIVKPNSFKKEFRGHFINDVVVNPLNDDGEIIYADRKNRSNLKKGVISKDRALWEVYLGLPLIELLKSDIPFYRSPEKISQLKYGAAQAVVRFCETHNFKLPNGGYTLDFLLTVICGNNAKPEVLRKKKYELKNLCKDDLAQFNLEIVDDRLVKIEVEQPKVH